MKKFFKQKILIYLLTAILCIGMEMCMHLIIYGQPFPTYIIFELIGIFGVLAPIFFFKRNGSSVGYAGTVFGIFTVLTFMNLTMNFCSGDIFSFNYISLVGEVGAVMSIHYINPWYVGLVLLFILIFVLGIVLLNHLFNFEDKKAFYKEEKYLLKGSVITISMILIALIGSFFSILAVEKDYHSKDLYLDKNGSEITTFQTNYFKKNSLHSFGLVNFTFNEAGKILSGNVSNSDYVEINDYFKVYENPYQINNGYKGLLAGKNVITIMIETGIEIDPDVHPLPFGITKELTPTLYYLRENGLNFVNNHSKNKTNMSEFIGINGSLPQKISSKGYEIPYSVPNVLKHLGYQTNFFHDNSGSFYSREKIMPSMGFDHQYFFDDIHPEGEEWGGFDGNYPLDDYFMDLSQELMVPEKTGQPFYTFYTTLSMHGPYNVGYENMKTFRERGYYDKIDEQIELGNWDYPITPNEVDPYSEKEEEKIRGQLKCFQAEYMAFDAGVKILLDRLVETDQLDDTLLIFYGDHESYYQSQGCHALKNYIYGIGQNNNLNDPKQYRTIMFMYNNELTKHFKLVNGLKAEDKARYTYFSTPYLIVPTIMELLGIDYNGRTYVGKSAFQVTNSLENIFYSHELSCVFTSKAYTNSNGEEFQYVIEDIPDTYLDDFRKANENLIYKIGIFNKIYDSDYFREVEDHHNIFNDARIK